jgi:hypothetical protein
MFGKQAYELLQEVAQCPADNLPAFNVRRRLSMTAASKMPPVASCNLVAEQILPTSAMQEETFRSVVDEVHLQHERLTTVYK